MTDSQLLVIFLLLFAVFGYFIRLARKSKGDRLLKSFFLGGAKIGSELTENNTLGITFAWSGGIWYFAWLAFQFGPIVLLSQVFWVISLVWLAIYYRKIKPRVKNKTLHGFLGDTYGVGSQRAGAIATTAGYVLNCGFEIFWSSLLFTACIGRADLALPVAILLALVAGAYCAIGGYRSNASTDKPQNMLGALALGALVFLVSRSVDAPDAMRSLSLAFFIGCILYAAVSYFLVHRVITPHRKILDVIAICFATSAVAISLSLFAVGGHHEPGTQTPGILDYSPIPLLLLAATIPFQVFFNLVDMQNWQQIAANADLPDDQTSNITWSIIRGSLYLFWFPALGGVILGCLMRAMSDTQITDLTIFPHAFELVMPGEEGVVRAVVIGLIFAGLLSSALSTADNLLMSSLQTLFYDIKDRARVQRLLAEQGDEDEEKALIERARRWLPLLAVGMVLVFYGLYVAFSGGVFLFQSLMYALPLSLLAPVCLGLSKSPKAAVLGKWAFGAIGLSIASVAIIASVAFLVPSVAETNHIAGAFDAAGTDKEWLIALTPVVANVVSTLILLTGWLLTRPPSAERPG